ncbi:hypothetical protein FE257_005205 [Aspergillus nanangensis]|uniref:SUN domain-containing protein n=1 Tax=Aspergillus nanangensis TaxID=2582783 RepID=A0AAD4CR88_ASPNN|nr:hypothetical protein FE257_005205 [Aspergillus nanangensis]
MIVPAWAKATSIPLAALVANWIDGAIADTHPPVCLTRDWREIEAGFLEWPKCIETRWEGRMIPSPTGEETISVTVSEILPTDSSAHGYDERHDSDTDTDSLLDNANFLSFEDWKKQNLAKVGQSAENVGGSRRAGAAGKEDRHRPTGINNALDSLGDDAEIELDFGGFGADTPETAKPTPWGAPVAVGEKGAAREDDRDAGDVGSLVPRAGGTRGKDAGTTCKERFNYASFDCAATVLKTNSECKGSSSVLIENKDSYMLNECRANNKFLILELCDDILVDTVVLANYEFFSSIFHTFRVSVSDRYPAKPDQWRELGVYEARNTREVQAFAVENPLIWARYLRIEFLTHYGNEFYCPVSLIRVHGTTMLEEYKHDGDAGRSEEEVSDHSSIEVGPSGNDVEAKDPQPPTTVVPIEIGPIKGGQDACPNPEADVKRQLLASPLTDFATCNIKDMAIHMSGSNTTVQPDQSEAEATRTKDATAAVSGGDVPSNAPVHDPKMAVSPGASVDSPSSSSSTSSTTTVSETATQNTTSDSETKWASSKEDQNSPPESTRSTGTQPPSSNPTTQESFFKSVNKRLQMLESNSTLSLLYIEEQSRILRDAFNKVEKRQLSKTSNFLESLNVTVLNELKQFREQYDQVWKSVALEFEHQRIQYHQEIFSISTQLGVLADELVFQKRVSVIQSIMVLFCFALVLFSRSTVSSYIDFPRVQNMVSRSYSLRSSSPIFGSPSASPSSTRPVSSYRGPADSSHPRHQRNISDDSQDGPLSPTIEYSPPTPTSDGPSGPEVVVAMEDEGEEVEKKTRGPSPSGLSIPEMAPVHVRSRSSPPVMDGGRELEEAEDPPSSDEEFDVK